VQIAYKLERVCLPMPERLRASRWGLAALKRYPLFPSSLNYYYSSSITSIEGIAAQGREGLKVLGLVSL